MFIFYSDETLPAGSTNDLFNIDPNNLTGTIPYSKLPDLAGITLSGDAVPPYISSITPPITPSGTQTIEIIGEYFSPITQLNIPGVTVNNLEVRSPNKIIADISKSDLLRGEKIITLANGASTNQIWAEGIKSVSIGDPYWANVSLFIKGDGENNSTNIIDSSPIAKTVSSFGAKISTNTSKYGQSSIVFNGSGDYLSIPAIGDLLFTTQTFTWELWINFQSMPTGTPMGIISTARGETGNYGIFLCADSNTFRARDWKNPNGPTKTGINTNTWYHLAITKIGFQSRLWVNGIEGAPGTVEPINTPHTNLIIGSVYNNGGYAVDFHGYIDSLRITTGIARYTANFNPETDTFLDV